MNTQKQNIENPSDEHGASKELEITVELSVAELKPYIEQACVKISNNMKVEGFRPGKAPYDILKRRVDEMTIWTEAANIAVNKTVAKVLKEQIKDENIIGEPQVRLTKIAPGSPLEYKIIISLMPEIKLGKYKDLGIDPPTASQSGGRGEVEKVLKDLQNMRAKEKLVNREIKDGDKVLVDISMFLDKVPIEGGQSQGAGVFIGADYIVPGFDKNLIGAKKGDVREFTLPYPKDHYQKNLAGRLVEFKVTIKDVYEREVPEVNDEFAKALGMNSLQEMKDKLRKNIEQEKKQKAEQKAVIEIFETILKNTTFSHIPETMTDTEAHNMIHELKHNVEQQGGKFDDYLTHIKRTAAELEKEFRPEAVKRVKTSFIISEIVKAEGVKVSEEDLQKALDKQIEAYADNPELRKKAKTEDYKNYVRYNMLNQKVIEKLKEWNVQ